MSVSLDPNVRYAGFWIRVAATIIDTVLLIAVVSPILVYIYGWDYFDPERTGFVAGTADLLVGYVFPMIAVIAFWVARQATPGKMAVSARIVDAESGKAPTVGQCVGRYFAYFVSTLPLLLGYIWIAFDERKQGWHDKLAGTVVIIERRGANRASPSASTRG